MNENICISRMKILLGKAQGLQVGQQHPFPWYPPVCTTITDIPDGHRSYDHIGGVKERSNLQARIGDPSMKGVNILLN